MGNYLSGSDIQALIKLKETMPEVFNKAWSDKKLMFFECGLSVLQVIDGLMTCNDYDRVLESHPRYCSLGHDIGTVIIIEDWQQEFARCYGIVWGSTSMVATIKFCRGRYLWPNPLESIQSCEWLQVSDSELLACKDDSEESFPLLNTRSLDGEIITALYDKIAD